MHLQPSLSCALCQAWKYTSSDGEAAEEGAGDGQQHPLRCTMLVVSHQPNISLSAALAFSLPHPWLSAPCIKARGQTPRVSNEMKQKD